MDGPYSHVVFKHILDRISILNKAFVEHIFCYVIQNVVICLSYGSICTGQLSIEFIKHVVKAV